MRTARCAPVKFSRCAGRQAMRVSASAAKIKVIGCGGGGGNAVNRMISSGLHVRDGCIVACARVFYDCTLAREHVTAVTTMMKDELVASIDN